MSFMDLYDVLGCSKESTQEQIKRAYHALALRFHPDKCATEFTDEKFQRILKAWNILGQSELRKEYDLELKQEELDAQSIPIYAKVSLNELADEQGEVFTYPCRCGSKYHVQKEDLKEKNQSIQVPCQDCTFFIVVST